jgi:hypothetical protein
MTELLQTVRPLLAWWAVAAVGLLGLASIVWFSELRGSYWENVDERVWPETGLGHQFKREGWGCATLLVAVPFAAVKAVGLLFPIASSWIVLGLQALWGAVVACALMDFGAWLLVWSVWRLLYLRPAARLGSNRGTVRATAARILVERRGASAGPILCGALERVPDYCILSALEDLGHAPALERAVKWLEQGEMIMLGGAERLLEKTRSEASTDLLKRICKLGPFYNTVREERWVSPMRDWDVRVEDDERKEEVDLSVIKGLAEQELQQRGAR